MGTLEQKKAVYTEDTSKTNFGGIRHGKVKQKVVEMLSTDCHPNPVTFVEEYLNMLSPKAVSFYCRPLQRVSGLCGYSVQPIGVHTLDGFMKTIQKEAGWDVNLHFSLRATNATLLQDANIPAKVIMESMGHRSMEALGMYIYLDVLSIEYHST